MKYFFLKFKKPLLRLAAVVLVFGTASLVLLYFLGYYDLSFLDRYKVLGEIFDDTPVKNSSSSVFFDPSELLKDDVTGESAETDVSETETLSGSAAEDADEGYLYYETKSVKSVFSEEKLPDKLLTTSRSGSKTVAALLAEGYHAAGTSYSEAGLALVPQENSGEGDENVPAVVTASYVPGQTVLGKLTFSFQLPDSFSLRRRQTVRETIVTPEDDSEAYVQAENVREERPAVELYMGYLLVDDSRNLALIASDATPLCMIDERVYLPAYVRDRQDRPLFYRTGEDGEKLYFYLSADGKTFVRSDYDETADSRGLRFDYPASYGKSDSTVVYTHKSQETGLMGYLVKDVGMLTTYRFTRAYAFTSNRGAVTTEDNRGGMYFVDENGKQAFPTWYTYLNEYDRYVFNNLMPPLTDGLESIGFYYFDHGLTRVRRQIIDNWNWSIYRRVRVVSDEQILIRPDGSEYELPAGYTLEGYSEGMLLLSKDGRYGFLDYTGEWIAQPIYAAATPFVCGLATLTTSDGRVGMIDTEGNIVLQFTYDSISTVSDGLIAAYREENGWTILKMMEKDA
ncbi:MAG: WG repeat-containing protein [Eubacteriales bacterium]